jgi:hypothetical protein
MQIKIIATLPHITIEGDDLQLIGSKISKLPFTTILEFENKTRSDAYNKQEFKYRNHPPVFFEKTIDIADEKYVEDDTDFIFTLREITKPYINELVFSLYFYTGIPVLTPFVSTIYFDGRFEENYQKMPELRAKFQDFHVYRWYGESDKEYTFINESPTITIPRPSRLLCVIFMLLF